MSRKNAATVYCGLILLCVLAMADQRIQVFSLLFTLLVWAVIMLER